MDDRRRIDLRIRRLHRPLKQRQRRVELGQGAFRIAEQTLGNRLDRQRQQLVHHVGDVTAARA